MKRKHFGRSAFAWAASLVASVFLGGAFASIAHAAPQELTLQDVVSPLEVDRDLQGAQNALERGDLRQAEALLQAALPSEFRDFLVSKLLVARASATKSPEDAAKAAHATRELAVQWPLIADYFTLSAAQLAVDSGDRDQALADLKKISQTSLFSPQAVFLSAQIYEDKGDFQKAYELYAKTAAGKEPRSGTDVAAQALLAQARLAQKMGKADVERATLLKVWRDHPRTRLSVDQSHVLCLDGENGGQWTPNAQTKNDFTKEKRTSLPNGGCPNLTVEDRLKRAERLVELHHNQRGIEGLKPLVATLKFPSEQGCRARFFLGDAHRKERLHEDAIKILTDVVASCPKQKHAALYALASSQSIAHPERGSQFYDRYIREFPASTKLDQAQWFAADLEIKNGDFEAVNARLAALVQTYPKSRYAPDALFKRFWLAWVKDKCTTQTGEDSCEGWLNAILTGWPNNMDAKTRAQYWLGRLHLEKGQKNQAVKAWTSLANSAFQRFYGEMALMGLQKLDPQAACRVRAAISETIFGKSASVAPVASLGVEGKMGDAGKSSLGVSQEDPRQSMLALLPRKLGAVRQKPLLDEALQFMRLGLTNEARERLISLAREKSMSRDDRMTLAILLGISGDLRGAQIISRIYFPSVFERPIEAKNRSLWMLAWPRAYRSFIEEKCSKRGVAPDQIQALMREESALDPNARSWAGALGLTQMMPTRAREVAQMADMVHFEEEDLFRPEIAVELGCVWLGKLLETFHGEQMHAFAAYNADTRRVRLWDEGIPAGELDWFVEKIPIAETRNYVKRLVQSEAIYGWLYGARVTQRETCTQ